MPLVDGGERIGVVRFSLATIDDDVRAGCDRLAMVMTRLLLSRGRFTDSYFVRRRRREMNLAAEMQWSLLPPISFTYRDVEIAAILEPAYDVAGDAFDYAFSEGHAEIAVFDCIGHGLSSSVMASVAVGAYRHARRRRLDLASTQEGRDEVVARQFGEETLVTAQISRLDCSTGRFDWINAGHPSPLLVRRGKVIGPLHCVPCLPLGLAGGRGTIATESLEPGDRVLFYTDGITEGISPDTGEEFGAPTDRPPHQSSRRRARRGRNRQTAFPRCAYSPGEPLA